MIVIFLFNVFVAENSIQAVLVIRRFAIRGFDYSRTVKHMKTANGEGKKTSYAEFTHKLVVLVFADSKFLCE